MTTKFLLTMFLIALAHAQAAQKRPPKPGVSTPGVKREMSALTPDAVFPIEGTPDWQVLTEDALWVTNGPKNTVHRLDVNTNRVVAAVEVGKKPCSGLAAGFGSIWVPNCGDKTLSRIDIATNRVVATLPLGPADSEGGIAAGPDAVWMLTDAKGVLSRIDPTTNKAIAEIAVTAGSASCIYAEGAVWITTPGKNLLTRVDPRTNAVVATIDVGPGPRFLTAGAGSIWTLNQGDGTISRVDARSNKLLANIEAGIPGGGGEARVRRGTCVERRYSASPLPKSTSAKKRGDQAMDNPGPGGDSIRVGHGSIWLSNLRQQNVWRLRIDQP